MKPQYWDELQTLAGDPVVEEARLRQKIESPLGQILTWVLVEGEADPWFYDKFFKVGKAKVVKVGKEGTDGVVRGGYHNVIDVTSHILNEGYTDRIIGIIDKDYRNFNPLAATAPANVFVTDLRDVEMTMLSNSCVRTKLKTEILSALDSKHIKKLDLLNKYEELWDKCVQFCRFLGYFHIAAASIHLPFRLEFRKKLYWDDTLHQFKPKAKMNVYKYTVHQCMKNNIFSPIGLFLSYKFNRLNRVSDWDVCRGHDFMELLSSMLIDSVHFSAKWITYFIAKEHTPDMIRCLSMYNDIRNWQRSKGLEILV